MLSAVPSAVTVSLYFNDVGHQAAGVVQSKTAPFTDASIAFIDLASDSAREVLLLIRQCLKVSAVIRKVGSLY